MEATTSVNQSLELKRASMKTIIFASLIGTSIEFFDFYAYGTAAASYFPKVFFPTLTPAIAILLSLLTFGVAFVARPIGSFVFGHYGDKMGRKNTLLVSLLLMGCSTVLIGLLPSYQSIGFAAVLLLCACRFFQGIGLGGEWSGAVLVATENAPANRRALYGSFPELGAPIGFFLCNGLFFVLESIFTADQMIQFGWRIPFIASAVMVVVGLVVRHHLEETPMFQLAQEKQKVTESPLKEVFTKHWVQVFQGAFIISVAYTFFYMLTTWSLSFATTNLGFSNREYLLYLMSAIVMFGVVILLSGYLADKFGRKHILLVASSGIAIFSMVFPRLLTGQHDMTKIGLFLVIGFALMGLIYGPMGAILPELFPVNVRYTGSGLAYNLSSIIGAAFAPTIATWLAENWGIHYVGFYLLLMAVLSVVSLLFTKDTKEIDYSK